MPLDGTTRSAGVNDASYRGPRGDAAVMWAATPRLTVVPGSEPGPDVIARHAGLLQTYATRLARVVRTGDVNSSRTSGKVTPPSAHSRRDRGSFWPETWRRAAPWL